MAVAARAGDTLAAALLADGFRAFRRDTRNAPRGPYCLAGACYECLVEINVPSATQAPRWQRVRACLTLAANGIEVRSATAVRSFE